MRFEFVCKQCLHFLRLCGGVYARVPPGVTWAAPSTPGLPPSDPPPASCSPRWAPHHRAGISHILIFCSYGKLSRKKSGFFMEIFQMGSDPSPPLILASSETSGAHFIYGGHMGSYGGHIGVIWGSYGHHMRLMEVLWCHIGIILEAYHMISYDMGVI